MVAGSIVKVMGEDFSNFIECSITFQLPTRQQFTVCLKILGVEK